MNHLSAARSPYLRSAQHQPVDWHEWSPETFALALAEDKPILLDIGAVWCHWCHVMDRESYENATTAALINDHFVAIKVDRDERPDVDARYQAAVAAISGGGGWPLTAFLTPAGKPFFGGTYFPPVDAHGRPGLPRVVATMAEAFYQRRDEVEESALSVMAAIEANETFEATVNADLAAAPDPLFEPLLQQITAGILALHDPRHGGFGSQPKFPNSAALDLLLDTGARPGPHAVQSRQAAMLTLERMSKGGIYDHLAGGFHRYSVDERWTVPHFEKMLYDNAGLLANYVHAYQSTGERECGRIARELLRWLEIEMTDRADGGFFSSQDADVDLADDGDYFTWTRDEAAAVLSPQELALAEPFFDIGPLGDMHHNPAKNTLHIDLPLPTVAQRANVSLEQAAELIAAAKQKLHAARQLRPTPFIDRTLYTAWNSMMVSATLEAGRALNLEAGRALNLADATAFALKTLDRLLAVEPGVPHVVASEAKRNVGVIPTPLRLPHVLAYADGTPGTLPGLLDDYLFTAHAALDAWQATGLPRYYQAAESLTQTLLENFHDPVAGGFYDTENATTPQLGALTTRRKPLQDAPTPAGNPVAASLLLRLAELNGDPRLRELATETLALFTAAAPHLGIYAAAYAQALRRLVTPHTLLLVAGNDGAADALERAALQPYTLTRTVVRLRTPPAELPPAIPTPPSLDTSYALVCKDQTCQPPALTPEALTRLLQT